jgi:hypothetical protein
VIAGSFVRSGGENTRPSSSVGSGVQERAPWESGSSCPFRAKFGTSEKHVIVGISTFPMIIFRVHFMVPLIANGGVEAMKGKESWKFKPGESTHNFRAVSGDRNAGFLCIGEA